MTRSSTMKKGIAACVLMIVSQYATAQERIISAGGAVTELIYALGAEQQLVAVDVTSRVPAEAQLPKIGYHRQLSAEGLMALAPDRIIGSDEMGPETTLTQIKQSGINVDIINTKPTVTGLLERIDDIARLTNTTDKADKIKTDVEQQVKQLNSNIPLESKQKKVLFLLVHEGRPANVAGKNTTADAVIQLAGATNPAAEQLESYKPLSMEAMVSMQPDVILVSGRSWKTLGGADALLKALPMLAATPAGKNKAIEAIDGSALVGGLDLKSLSEAKRLNLAFYP